MIDEPENKKLRVEIEPWLTALFQSEHLSLVLGAGISSATHQLAREESAEYMDEIPFSVFQNQISQAARSSAENSGRGEPNIEDQIRVCNELIRGMEIYTSGESSRNEEIQKDLKKLQEGLDNGLEKFAIAVLECERNIVKSPKSEEAPEYLMSFLIMASIGYEERLNIYTTTYDRMPEYGSELAGFV